MVSARTLNENARTVLDCKLSDAHVTSSYKQKVVQIWSWIESVQLVKWKKHTQTLFQLLSKNEQIKITTDKTEEKGK